MNNERMVAGDTLDFTVSVPDYPASDGWTLKYRLVPRDSGNSAITITATANANGTDYDIEVAPATTATWSAGYYAWWRWVEKSGARQTLDDDPAGGEFWIAENPETMSAGTDTRSHARKVLDAIEAVIENRASLDQENYTINGRSLSRTPLQELMRLRARYKSEVEAEWRERNDVTGGRKLVFRL